MAGRATHAAKYPPPHPPPRGRSLSPQTEAGCGLCVFRRVKTGGRGARGGGRGLGECQVPGLERLPRHKAIGWRSFLSAGRLQGPHRRGVEPEGERRGRVRRASGGRGGGRHGVWSVSGGVPSRGPGISPDLCPPARPSSPIFSLQRKHTLHSTVRHSGRTTTAGAGVESGAAGGASAGIWAHSEPASATFVREAPIGAIPRSECPRSRLSERDAGLRDLNRNRKPRIARLPAAAPRFPASPSPPGPSGGRREVAPLRFRFKFGWSRGR